MNLNDLSKEDLKHQYDIAESESLKFRNYEQAVKLILNSMYGAFGNNYFHFFNIDLAEAITLQCQDAILYTEVAINKYFNDFWHKDKELHKLLDIEVTDSIKDAVVIYIDTDSCYVSFEEVYQNANYDGDVTEFIKDIYEYRLKNYIKNVLYKYSDKWNTDSFLKFELETIAYSAIWLSKKKYIQNIAWEDPGIDHNKLEFIKATGFEIVQSSSPSFVRTKLKEALILMFKDDNPNLSELVSFLKDVKKEFKLANIEEISFSKRVNNIEKYIIDDYSHFEVAKSCPINVRAAGYYNYLLNNSEYKSKYHNIPSGEKVRIYFTDDNLSNVFAFMPDEHPYEFAPNVDYDLQFEKSILDPLNRVIKAVGLKTLNSNLIYAKTLF